MHLFTPDAANVEDLVSWLDKPHGITLDVAGGKGELAFELVNLNRIPTTVVDPRPLDLSSYKRKFEYGIYWRNPLMHVYINPGDGEISPEEFSCLGILFGHPLVDKLLSQHT